MKDGGLGGGGGGCVAGECVALGGLLEGREENEGEIGS